MINQWWLVNNHFVVFSYHFWFHATRCFVCSGCWPRLRSPVESHRSPPVQVPSRMERRLDGSTPNCWGFLPKAQRPSQLPFKTPDAKKPNELFVTNVVFAWVLMLTLSLLKVGEWGLWCMECSCSDAYWDKAPPNQPGGERVRVVSAGGTGARLQKCHQ